MKPSGRTDNYLLLNFNALGIRCVIIHAPDKQSAYDNKKEQQENLCDLRLYAVVGNKTTKVLVTLWVQPLLSAHYRHQYHTAQNLITFN